MLKINYPVRRTLPLNLVLAGATCLSFVSFSRATKISAAAKTVIDYFLPMPIFNHLDSDKWGCAAVGKRDIYNGLEDTAMSQYTYWDGQIIKGPGRQISHVCQPLEPGRGP